MPENARLTCALLIPPGGDHYGSGGDHPIGRFSERFGEIAPWWGLNAKTAPSGGGLGFGVSGWLGGQRPELGREGGQSDHSRAVLALGRGAVVICARVNLAIDVV